MRVVREDGTVVCERCAPANTPLKRLRGLLGKAALSSQEGILLKPAGSIHTAFMRFPIDAVFLDRELVVIGVSADMKPWRMAARRGAKSVLELRAGEAVRRGLAPGDRLALAEEQGDEPAEG